MFIQFLRHIVFFLLHVDYSISFPPPLSKEEELSCFQDMKNGNSQARDKLIEHNLRLVAHVVKKYYTSANSQDELISIGTIGLIKAVSTFDYTKGNRFASYASRCIENEILMTFRSQKKLSSEVSIYEPIDTDKDGNQLTLIDVIEDGVNVETTVENNIRAKQLDTLINNILNEREKEIISMRYGLKNGKEMPQREVAKKLGISRSYVSRLEKKILEKLRRAYESI